MEEIWRISRYPQTWIRIAVDSIPKKFIAVALLFTAIYEQSHGATWERLKKLLDSSQTLLNYNCRGNLFNSGWWFNSIPKIPADAWGTLPPKWGLASVAVAMKKPLGMSCRGVHSHGATPKLAGWCHGKSLWKISGWWLGVPPWLGSFPTWTSAPTAIAGDVRVKPLV